jgi:hypothetical protein
MDEKQKAEVMWAYCISHEKVIRRLLEKEYISQEDADEILVDLYDNLKENKGLSEWMKQPQRNAIIKKYLRSVIECDSYISLTDIAREVNKESPSYVIQSWLRSRNTIEFLRLWEKEKNSKFNDEECVALLESSKKSTFTLTLKQWISKTNAIGFISNQGKNGGTFAHPEIVCDFQLWLRPDMRLTLIRHFNQTKGAEEKSEEQ